MSDHNEDAIWNRACSPRSERLKLPGDRALADMVLVHSLIMNGGVHHVLEVLSAHEIAAGMAGYKYFNLVPIFWLTSEMTRARPNGLKATNLRQIDAMKSWSLMTKYWLTPSEHCSVRTLTNSKRQVYLKALHRLTRRCSGRRKAVLAPPAAHFIAGAAELGR